MAGKREKPEDIVLKLRQVEVLQGQGKPLGNAVRQIGETVQTYYRWRKEYGGMSRDQLKRLKLLEIENARFRVEPLGVLRQKCIDYSAGGSLVLRLFPVFDERCTRGQFGYPPGCLLRMIDVRAHQDQQRNVAFGDSVL